MRVIERLVVFDRGGLMESEPWVRMHETITGAVQTTAHVVIGRRVAKRDPQGRLSKQFMGNDAGSIKGQLLANLRAAVRQAGGTEDLDGLGELARASGNLLMVEYPSRRRVSCDDEDFGALIRWEAGGFDALFVADNGFRCVVKLESGNESSAHYTVGKLCSFMRAGLVDCGVLIVSGEALAGCVKGEVTSWDVIDAYLSVWHRMGDRVEHGLFVAMGIEQDDRSLTK